MILKKSIILLVIIGISVFIPIPIESSPEWKIRNLDLDRKPISDVYVKRSWIHASAENKTHSDKTFTDKEGYAYFPPQYVKTTIISVVSRAIKNFIP